MTLLEKPPEFATDPTFLSGPQTGLSPRLAMSSGAAKQGMIPDTVVAARYANHVLGTVSDCVRWMFDQIAALRFKNWTALHHETEAANLDEEFVAGWPDDSFPVILHAVKHFSSTDTRRFTYVAGLLSDSSVRITRTLAGYEHEDISPTGLGTDTTPRAMTSNDDGSVVMFSGTGTTIGNTIRRNTGYTTSWSTIACHAGAGGYADMSFSTGTTFYASPSAALSNKVGVSTNGGATWAAVSGSVPAGWSAIINASLTAAPSSFVVYSALKDKVLVSASGASFAESSIVFGSGIGVGRVVWSAPHAKWFAQSAEDKLRIASSADGITWVETIDGESTDAGGTPALVSSNDDSGALIACERVGGRVSVWFSVDAGFTWVKHGVGERFDSLDPAGIPLSYGGGTCWLLAAEAGVRKGLWRSLKI